MKGCTEGGFLEITTSGRKQRKDSIVPQLSFSSPFIFVLHIFPFPPFPRRFFSLCSPSFFVQNGGHASLCPPHSFPLSPASPDYTDLKTEITPISNVEYSRVSPRLPISLSPCHSLRSPYLQNPLIPYQQVLDVGDALKNKVGMNGRLLQGLFLRDASEHHTCRDSRCLSHCDVCLQTISNKNAVPGF